MRDGQLLTGSGEVLDEVLAVYMPAGRSYTGLDQVEIFCHGGRQVVRRILDEIVRAGARPAEPGEFTKLAFLSGRIDLSRAEAVAEMIAASTQVSYEAGREHLVGAYSRHIDGLRDRLVTVLADVEAAIDFSDEEVDSLDNSKQLAALDEIDRRIEQLVATYDGGRIIREGYQIAICGRANAGKSSLFNLLLEQERALVDPEAGTTRDYLSEWLDLDGFAVNIIDTAGFRNVAERVEKQGQERSQDMIAGANLVIWMADVSESDWDENLRGDAQELGETDILLIGNKIDLVADASPGLSENVLPLSCRTGSGLNQLRRAILAHINASMPDLTSGQVVTSARHKRCLELASDAAVRAKSGIKEGESAEIVAFELRQAADALGEITGKVYTEEILGEIFSRFCIGK